MSLQANYARRALAVAVIALGVTGVSFADAASTVIPLRWKNCTQVNKRYPHGVGRRLAHDKTSGTPVTTFRRSNLLYGTAMRYNRGLDRDKDGIACEKL
jgi:Excalibur calcium-binding domain